MRSLALLYLFVVTFVLASCRPQAETSLHQSVGQHIQIKNSTIYYEIVGQGKPVMLFHAGYLNNDMWATLIDSLKEQFQFIALDLPAHGKSVSRDTALMIADVARAIIDKHKLGKVSVAGVSLGGGAALDFMLKFPDHVDKAVIVSSTVQGLNPDQPQDSVLFNFMRRIRGALQAEDVEGGAEVFAQYWAEGPNRKKDELDSLVRNYVHDSALENMTTHAFRNWQKYYYTNAVDELSRITNPVLIMVGDRDVDFILRSGEVMKSKIPNSVVIHYPNAGHMLNMEEESRFAMDVERFLTQ
ncbi:MAG TPA: alpha/beta hydrolase [Chryseosolibacter sp.]